MEKLQVFGTDKSKLIELFRASDASCTKRMKMGNGDMKTKCVTKQLTLSIQIVLPVKCVRMQYTCRQISD